ncbi:TolC family protein [Zavarzinella formosa]|uniref:TolC family protein n=1 Tax=Zavarzinella formosa TaxID=360055 RepID=UPI0002EB7114|nr:TolC family protein [Zavarzinella formosa]
MESSRHFSKWAAAILVGGIPFSFAGAQPGPTAKIELPAPAKTTPPAPPPGTLLKEGELPIDLATALQLAGSENPELMLARERLTEAGAIQQLAAAQILPNINLGTNYDLHRGALQQSNGNILKVNRDAMYVGLGASAIGGGTVNIPGINYNLNVGTAWYGYLQTQQVVARVAAATKTAENNVLLRVCLAYTELLRAEARRAVATQNRSEADELTKLTAAYAKTGQGRKADADRAAVELRKRDAELTQAEADILTASARLAQLLNLGPTTRLKPIDGWVVPAPIVPDPVPLAELIAIALMQRPELAERRAEIQEALYALSSAKILPFSPNVILGFSSGTFGGGSNLVSSPTGVVAANGSSQTGPRFGNFDGRTDFDAVMYWTLQNLGVGNLALIRAADSRAKQANWRERETFNRVRTDVAESHARVNARFLQIDIAAKAFEASQEAYTQDLARIKGREGLPIEVIDSLRLLSRSRYEYLDAVIDYNRYQFQLYVALGQPPAAALARPVPAGIITEKK